MNAHQKSFPDERPDHGESGRIRQTAPAGATSKSARTITSAALFDGQTEIGIEHGDAVYRLKITRQGKLILNK